MGMATATLSTVAEAIFAKETAMVRAKVMAKAAAKASADQQLRQQSRSPPRQQRKATANTATMTVAMIGGR